LKAPESSRQYPARLKVYLDFLGFEGDVSLKFVLTYNT
jgi:hypothetical protein